MIGCLKSLAKNVMIIFWGKYDEKYGDETGGVVTLIGCLKSLAQ